MGIQELQQSAETIIGPGSVLNFVQKVDIKIGGDEPGAYHLDPVAFPFIRDNSIGLHRDLATQGLEINLPQNLKVDVYLAEDQDRNSVFSRESYKNEKVGNGRRVTLTQPGQVLVVRPKDKQDNIMALVMVSDIGRWINGIRFSNRWNEPANLHRKVA